MKVLITLMLFLSTLFSSTYIDIYIDEIGRDVFTATENIILKFEHGGKKPKVSTKSKSGAHGLYQFIGGSVDYLRRKYKNHPLIVGKGGKDRINSWNWKWSKEKQRRLFILELLDIKDYMVKHRFKATALKYWVLHNLGKKGGIETIKSVVDKNYYKKLMTIYKRKYLKKYRYFTYKSGEWMYKSTITLSIKKSRRYERRARYFTQKAKWYKRKAYLYKTLVRNVKLNLPKSIIRKITKKYKGVKRQQELLKAYVIYWAKRYNKLIYNG